MARGQRLAGNNRKPASPRRSLSGICGICFGTNTPLPDPSRREFLREDVERVAEARAHGGGRERRVFEVRVVVVVGGAVCLSQRPPGMKLISKKPGKVRNI